LKSLLQEFVLSFFRRNYIALCGLKTLSSSMGEEGICEKVILYSKKIFTMCEEIGILNCLSVYINNLIQLWMIQPEVSYRRVLTIKYKSRIALMTLMERTILQFKNDFSNVYHFLYITCMIHTELEVTFFTLC
jgi:hypothetical protein